MSTWVEERLQTSQAQANDVVVGIFTLIVYDIRKLTFFAFRVTWLINFSNGKSTMTLVDLMEVLCLDKEVSRENEQS